MFNVIADIAGQYDTLLALLKKMPEGTPISLGDMIDRGPKSKEVLDFFMKNGMAVLGNHEHMMLDQLREKFQYEHNIWQYNGGYTTLDSFGHQVPDEYLSWLEELPTAITVDAPNGEMVLLSHAFVHPMFETIEEAEAAVHTNPYSDAGEVSIIWNRGYPIPRPGYKLQICGHNSQYGLRWITADDNKSPSLMGNNEPFALCLDDSRRKKLTGIHLPTMEIFQQDFI